MAWCNYKTTILRYLKRHIQAKHRLKRLKKYLYCDYQTISGEKLRSHKKEHKSEVLARHHCSVCKLAFSDSESFENHLNKHHPKNGNFEMIQTAFSNQLRVYCRNVREKAADTACLWAVFEDLNYFAEEFQQKNSLFSKQISVCMEFLKKVLLMMKKKKLKF